MNTPSRRIAVIWLTITMMLVGCGGPKPQAADDASKPITDVPPVKSITVLTWTENIPQDVLDAFTAETGTSVQLTTVTTNAQMHFLLERKPIQADVIIVNDSFVENLISDGELLPLPRSNLPNLTNIDSRWLDLEFDRGNQYSVPYIVGLAGILYDKTLVPGGVTGFATTFNTRFQNRIAIMIDARDLFSCVLLTLGIPVTDVTPASIQTAMPVFRRWMQIAGDGAIINGESTDSQIARALYGGEDSVAVLWNGTAAELVAKEPGRFAWVIPSEGTFMYIDSCVIPKTTPAPGTALNFINFLLRADISAKITGGYMPFLNPNKAGRALLTPEQLANPASYPTDAQLNSARFYRADKRMPIGQLYRALDLEPQPGAVNATPGR